MSSNLSLPRIRIIGVGLAFVVFPLVFVGGFATHPGLTHPHLLTAEEIISRAHGRSALQFGHMLITLSTALLIVAAIHFISKLNSTRGAWAGWIGGSLAVLGSVLLAADKGAFCLTMSALDTLTPQQFAAAQPALLAIFAKEGWLWITWGILLLPIGFMVQGGAILVTRQLPRWQAIAFLVGVALIGVPDGLEIVNLSASGLLVLALVPYGISLIRQNCRL